MTNSQLETHSPFPGMDPYTEARHLWKGLHTQLIGELSTRLLPPLLAPAYYVDAEPSLQIRTQRDIYPDIQVVTHHNLSDAPAAGLDLQVAEPTASLITLPEEEEENEENAIFIRTADSERLVTAIEILSYSNKTVGAEKRARYLLKRRELLLSGVHLVEVDLLRWGKRVINDLPDQPYHILVTRADERPQGRVWSFGFAQTIPDAPLPLLAPNEHVPLPLQTAYATIYQARNFRNRLAYQDEPESPLTLEQKRTLQQLLVAAGLREG